VLSSEQILDITAAQAIEQLQQEFGLSTQELAGALDASVRTIERWRKSATYPQHETRQRLAALIALDRRLRETFEVAEAIHTWLHAPNRYLGGLTPADAIRVGRFDRVDAALEALESGVFV
jgi:transcriptional regulator with XRE-family HTH domain